MNKAVKITLAVVGVGAVATLVYFLFINKQSPIYLLKPKNGNGGSGDEGSGSESESSDEGGTSGGSTSEQAECPYPKTPVSTRKEGNRFRAWVNDNYPAIAKVIDGATGKTDGLSRSGSYTNCYFRQAWHYKTTGGRTLGNLYSTAQSADSTPTTTESSEADYDRLRRVLDEQNIKYKLGSGNTILDIKTESSTYGANSWRYRFQFYPDGSWAMFYKKVDGSYEKAFNGKYGFEGTKLNMTLSLIARSYTGKLIAKKSTVHSSPVKCAVGMINWFSDSVMPTSLFDSYFAY
jgi:hypothetical protein